MKKLLLLVALFCAMDFLAESQTRIPNYGAELQMERLNRGVVAVRTSPQTVVVSWRMLATDAVDVAFDIYRKVNKGKAQKINRLPIGESTFYVDSISDAKANYTYYIHRAGEREALGSYALTAQMGRAPYIEIAMQPIDIENGEKYAPNDASVGDLDGDGEYEIVIKREGRSHDNAHTGVTDPLIVEAYKLNGLMLWRMNLGVNIRSGAHYTQFIVYDFDGDGKAEIALRTAEGTTFGDGQRIGDTNGDGVVDYVDREPESETYGMISDGPEFLSVVEGATGKELARADYISRGAAGSFGDRHANRVDRFLAGVGYMDGAQPSIIACRGYYARTVIEAWDFRKGELTNRWRFDTADKSRAYAQYEGQGNHNLSIGDVDGDGCDEITYGSFLLDHDGKPLYNTRLGHGDAMHLTDIDIDRPGLEVWDCHESVPSRAGGEMRDARTGELLWGIPAVEDVGRALTADIDPRFRGCEAWIISDKATYTADGRYITDRKPAINFAIWWDGDLNRELFNGSGRPGHEFAEITKWNGDGVDKIEVEGFKDAACNNWTKGTPCLQADIFGDWREELILRASDNKSIRIFTTDIPTRHRFVTLMSDPIYRIGVALQNVAYNQPPHTGFYLGSDLGKFARERFIRKNRGNGKSGVANNGRPNGMNERLKGATIARIDTLRCEASEITLDSGCDYHTIEWRIGNEVVGNDRFLTLENNSVRAGQTIAVEIRAVQHGALFEGVLYVIFAEGDSKTN